MIDQSSYSDRLEFNFSSTSFWWTCAFVLLFAIAALIYGVLLNDTKGYLFSGISFCYLVLSFLSNAYATRRVVVDFVSGQMTVHAVCSRNDEVILISNILSAESGVNLGIFSASWLKLYMNDNTTKRYTFDVSIESKNFLSIPREVCSQEVSELAKTINKIINK